MGKGPAFMKIWGETMDYERVRLDEAGRVVIPSKFRKALDIKKGEWLVIGLEDGEVRIFTIDEAIRRAQATTRKHVPAGVSLVDELIAERRAEAARE